MDSLMLKRRQMMAPKEEDNPWEKLDAFTIVPEDPRKFWVKFTSPRTISNSFDLEDGGYCEVYEYQPYQYSTNGGITWIKVPAIYEEEYYDSNGDYVFSDISDEFPRISSPVIKIKCDASYSAYAPPYIVAGDGVFDVAGSPMSLIYGDNWDENTKAMHMRNLFRYSKNVRRILNPKTFLPSVNLDYSAYYSMFDGCKILENIPHLPATVVSANAYEYMFSDCHALKDISDVTINVSSLGGYAMHQMFSNCIGLEKGPTIKIAGDLNDRCCGWMFDQCSSLTDITLEVTEDSVYRSRLQFEYAFRDCKALKNANITLAVKNLVNDCYSYMFRNCSSLEKAPVLPAITLKSGCYSGMFYGCSKLNYIKAMFITYPSSTYLSYWVYNIARSGIFVKNAAATWDMTALDDVLSGWTVETATE